MRNYADSHPRGLFDASWLSEHNLKICKALILSIYPIFISFAEDQDRHKSSKKEPCHLFIKQRHKHKVPTPIDHGINEMRKSWTGRSSHSVCGTRGICPKSFRLVNTYTRRIPTFFTTSALYFRACSRSTSYMKSKYDLSKWWTRTYPSSPPEAYAVPAG